MAKKETAEQKLLKIIEASKKAQDPASVAAAPAIKKPVGFIAISIQQFNYLLMLALVASAIYCVYEIRNGMALLNKSFQVSIESSKPSEALNLFVPQIKNISYYLDKINSRNIFQPFEQQEAGTQGAVTAKAALEKKIQKFKLVGVAWLDMPESATVMIEDTSNGVTRFLKEGEKLEDVTIKTIYTDRVVVGYENEEIVIKL